MLMVEWYMWAWMQGADERLARRLAAILADFGYSE